MKEFVIPSCSIVTGLTFFTLFSCAPLLSSSGDGGAGGSSKANSATSNSVYVAYNANVGGGIAPTDTNYYSAGQTVSVKYPEDLFPPGSEEGSFAGWNTSANGSGKPYTVGSTFSMGAQNVKLYAQWSILPGNFQSSCNIDAVRNMDTRSVLASVPASIQSGVFTDPADYLPQLVNCLVSSASDPVLRMKYIHDWIVSNIYYDWDNYLAQKDFDPSPYVTLTTRKTECNGLAFLFSTMCVLAGMNACNVFGYCLGTNAVVTTTPLMPHYWNVVQINSNYLFIDVTYDRGNLYQNSTYTPGPYCSGWLFVPPQYYILARYPTNQQYQFLNTPESLSAFTNTPWTFHGLSTMTSIFFEDGYTFSGTVTPVYQTGSSGASLQINLPAGTAPLTGAITVYGTWYNNWTFFTRKGLLAAVQMLPAVPGYATVILMDNCLTPMNVLADFLVYTSDYSATPDPYPYEYEPVYSGDFSMSLPLQGDLTAGASYNFIYSASNETTSTLYYWDSNNNACSNVGAIEAPSQGGAYNFTAMVTDPPSGFGNVLYVWMATNSTGNYGPFYIGYNVVSSGIGSVSSFRIIKPHDLGIPKILVQRPFP